MYFGVSLDVEFGLGRSSGLDPILARLIELTEFVLVLIIYFSSQFF